MKYIYSFSSGSADGNSNQKDLLGGKGANLAEMTTLGIPVPPVFTISTDVCRYFLDHNKLPDSLIEDIQLSISDIENLSITP